jgi:antitoxin component YwqK of YwqJK toxin-antitoxin module
MTRIDPKRMLFHFVLPFFFSILIAVTVVQGSDSIPDKFSGKWTINYENGAKKETTAYKNGKKHGISVKWYDNGCPMSIHHFQDDILNGPMIKWEICEDIIAIGEYRNGMPWDGYFMVSPTTKEIIFKTTVLVSNLAYFVAEFRDGMHFSPLSKKMLDRQMNTNPAYKELLNGIKIEQKAISE